MDKIIFSKDKQAALKREIIYQIPDLNTISACLNIPIEHILYSDSISSTQDELKQIKLPSPALSITQMQTQGHGRQGKSWFSPLAENLYFSYQSQINLAMNQWQGLSLVLGLACLEALRPLYPNLKLKWPNDIWADEHKIAGILIDAIHSNHLIVGIGINVHSLDLPKGATSLKLLCKQDYFIWGILIRVIQHIQKYIKIFETAGFFAFHEQIKQKDALNNKIIWVKQHQRTFRAKAMGIDTEGKLMVGHENGQIDHLNFGEISIGLEAD